MTFDIPKTMRAVVYRGINDLRLENVPVPDIGPGELLVKVAVCGVCPTDIKKIHYGLLPPPRIYGHETAGVIVKIGAASGRKTVLSVTGPNGRKISLKVGDRVALHHHVPCMTCHFCGHHAFAQCATYKRTGITAGFEPAGGGYAEYVRVMPFVLPGVVKIPPKITFEEAAMLEPVNTVLKAVHRLNVLPGDRVLVAGQGPIGLMFTRLLQLRGINVLGTDLLESRLKLAKKFGAKWTALADGRKSGERREKSTVRPGDRPFSTLHSSLFSHSGLDAAIIAVPSDAAVQQALHAVRGGGQILLFAHTKRAMQSSSQTTPKPDEGGPALRSFSEGGSSSSKSDSFFPLDLATICLDEKDLIGSYSSDFTLQNEVSRIIFLRQLDVRKLITHRFPLEKTAEAVALAAHPTEDSLKIVVTM